MEQDLKEFDLRTHVIDPKTGKLAKEQHYKMVISRADGTMYERPIGSGNWFQGNGTPAQKIEPAKEEVKQDQRAAQKEAK